MQIAGSKRTIGTFTLGKVPGLEFLKNKYQELSGKNAGAKPQEHQKVLALQTRDLLGDESPGNKIRPQLHRWKDR